MKKHSLSEWSLSSKLALTFIWFQTDSFRLFVCLYCVSLVAQTKPKKDTEYTYIFTGYIETFFVNAVPKIFWGFERIYHRIAKRHWYAKLQLTFLGIPFAYNQTNLSYILRSYIGLHIPLLSFRSLGAFGVSEVFINQVPCGAACWRLSYYNSMIMAY